MRSTTQLRLPGIALLFLTALCGCSAQTPTSAASSTAATPVSHVPNLATSQTPATADASDYQHTPGYTDTITFASPTGKFYCAMGSSNTPGDDHANCIGKFPSTVPMVKDCSGKQTHPNTIGVTTGESAEFSHACSPAAPVDAKVLPYNVILRSGTTQCVIHDTTGVTCKIGTGHGFTVSDTEYQLF